MLKSSIFILALVAIIAIIVGAGGAIVYFKFFNNPLPAEIISFSIEPSKNDGGWTMYKDGAQAVLIGKNIQSAVVMSAPTGTDMGNAKILGQMVKSEKSSEIWIFTLPKYLLATNFWAEATGQDGKVIKSRDLGNVGYQEN